MHFLMFCLQFLVYILWCRVEYCNCEGNTWQETKDALITANTFLDNINNNVDPCLDFYEYSCGNFFNNVNVNWANPSITTTDIRQNEYLSELRALFHAPKQLKEAEAIWKAKDFYTACMITNNKDKIGSLNSFISNVLGGLPILENRFWNNGSFDWFDVTGYLIKAGFKNVGFFDIYVDRHYPHNLDVTTPPLKSILSKFNYTTANADKYLVPMIERVVKYLDDETEYQNEEISHLVNFMLQYFTILDNKSNESKLQKQTVAELETLKPGLEWNILLKRLLHLKETSDVIINVKDRETLIEISDLMETTNKRILANYIIFNLLASFFLKNEIFIDFKTRKNTFLPTEDTFHEEDLRAIEKKIIHCVKHTTQISQAVRTMHFIKYFSSAERLKLTDLESHIYSAYLKIINLNNGSHFPSEIRNLLMKNYTLNVLKSIESQDLDDMYKLLHSHPIDHIANVLSLKQFQAHLMFSNYGNDIDLSHYTEMTEEVRYSENDENRILNAEIPQFLMRGIVYSNKRSQSLNYGMYGFKIAQSLISYTTSFKENGSDALLRFETCLKDQTENFTVHYPNLNIFIENVGDLLIKNIVVDIMSLQIAYYAYNDWLLKENRSDTTLPGVNRTSRQLFWLGYANMHCHDYDEEILTYLKNIYPLKLRIMNTLRNIPEFAQDYNCPTNSFMNSEEKCMII